MEKQYDKGDVIFREGDLSEAVIRVESGSVEILRDVAGETVVLGTVGEGEYLGEMGVIEGRPRIATARATSTVAVEIMTAKTFFERVSNDPATAYDLILRMSARLRNVEDRLVDELALGLDQAPSVTGMVSEDPAKTAAHWLELRPNSYALQWYVGTEPVRVEHFPYVVGRVLSAQESPGGPAPDLEIDDPSPHRLSRLQFSIVEEGGALHVRDLASALGTIVNGRALGSEMGRDRAPLEIGENEIVAGGAGSPYSFTAVVV